MYRLMFILMLFSQVSVGFTQTQIRVDHPEIPWGMVGVLAFALCVSCACVYLWMLNRRLLRSKHKLSVLWHRIPDVLTEVDINGAICAVNQPLAENLSIEDIVGTSSYDYLSQADASIFRASLKRALTENIEVEYELIAILEDEKRHLSNRIVPLMTDDHEPRALVITTDISHHVEASKTLHQARIQADDNAKSKADFLARMSHEIRTPLGGIIGMANLLHESEGKGDFKQFSEPLISSANHLQQIVDDVLDLAKTEQGGIQLDESDASLWQILDDLEALYVPQAVEKHISMSIIFAADVPRIIKVDAFRLRQVLYNLFSNAVKFTHEGSICLSITKQRLVDSQVLKFSVKDSGVGVSKGNQETIFDAFSQAKNQDAKRYGGTGLGLSICKNLVEVMGGVMGVESEESGGSEFWFTLPLKSTNNDHAFKSVDLTVGLAIKDAIKRKWFEAFLNAVSVNCQIISQDNNETQSVQLLITDYLLDSDVMNLWWVGVDYDLPDSRGVILYEPYRREALLSRITGYVEHQFESKVLLDEGADVNNLDYAKSMNGHSNITNQASATNGSINMIKPGNLLVVEDNLTNQMVIRKTLEKMGYQVSVANNGEEGVASFLNDTFQGVIMDVQMPVMDGIEATRQIRLVEDNYVPIIALTANAQDSVEEACFAAGMDAFLTKPINRAELQSTLESVLGMETYNKS